eukprot:6088833-Prymnesium_polylepis.1
MSSVNSVGGCVGGRWERGGERSQLQRRCSSEGWLALLDGKCMHCGCAGAQCGAAACMVQCVD